MLPHRLANGEDYSFISFVLILIYAATNLPPTHKDKVCQSVNEAA